MNQNGPFLTIKNGLFLSKVKKRITLYILPALLFSSQAFADTLILRNDRHIKGLVVEEHEDRIILSTIVGEIPVLRRGIKKIDYSDPAQNFMSVGKEYEKKQRWGEAIGYYEKAAEINPNLDEAKMAVARVRNRFWAKAAAGPEAEIEKRQSLHDNAVKQLKAPAGGPRADAIMTNDPGELLWQSLGVRLMKKGDWVHLSEISKKLGASARVGLRAGDRLVAVDGESLRYISMEAARQHLIEPRYSTFTLDYDRTLSLAKTGFEKSPKDFGFDLKLTARGLVISSLAANGLAARSGLKVEDAIVEVNGKTTRYVPVKKFAGVLQQTENQSDLRTVLTVRRSALLTRH